MLEPLARSERLTASSPDAKVDTEASMPRPAPKPAKRSHLSPLHRRSSAPSGWSRPSPSPFSRRSSAAISPSACSSTRASGSSSCTQPVPPASPTSIAGVPYELIRFGPDESATPQLTGWWIPADPGGRYAHLTILFLPDGNGSLADSVPTLASLHNLGLNVFAFDYRGYGQSAATRPSQQSMTHDVDSAWQYLTTSRAISMRNRSSPTEPVSEPPSRPTSPPLTTTIPALILDSPRADLLDTAMRDPRAKLVPVRLLFHERFPLAEPLSTLHTPKLLLSRSATPDPAFRTASDPKLTVELASPSALLYNQAITRFLDQYLAHACPHSCLPRHPFARFASSQPAPRLLLIRRNLL